MLDVDWNIEVRLLLIHLLDKLYLGVETFKIWDLIKVVHYSWLPNNFAQYRL